MVSSTADGIALGLKSCWAKGKAANIEFWYKENPKALFEALDYLKVKSREDLVKFLVSRD